MLSASARMLNSSARSVNGSRAAMFAPGARFASTGPKKKTMQALRAMKEKGEKVSWITSYTSPQASFAEAAGIDMILVGDSGGMCALGYANTIPVTMEEQLLMCKSARRGAPNTYIVGDMPFMSYQSSDERAVENAGRFIKEAGCDAIKLEGGVSCESRIKAIVDAGIAVFGHIGLTPQSGGIQGTLAQGRTAPEAKCLIEDAYAVQRAGAHYLLVEAVPPEMGHYIRSQLDIPVYGIGGGWAVDGQLLIISDVIGEFQAFTPKFVKKYCNVAEPITKAIADYSADVKSKAFPLDSHCYHVKKNEEEGIEKVFKEIALKPANITPCPKDGP